jgi:hypothetical protein
MALRKEDPASFISQHSFCGLEKINCVFSFTLFEFWDTPLGHIHKIIYGLEKDRCFRIFRLAFCPMLNGKK